MTVPAWLTFEFVRNLAVLLSAVIATLTYVRSERRQAKSARAVEVSFWVKTLIHSFFQRTSEKELRFDQIVSQTRIDAVAFKKFKIDADELSSEYIRGIVIVLIDSKILEQAGEDRYKIARVDRLVEEMFSGTGDQMAKMLSEMKAMHADGDIDRKAMSEGMFAFAKRSAQDKDVRDEILRQVTDEPFRYTRAELVLRVVKATGSANEAVKARTADMLVGRELTADDAGRIGPRIDPEVTVPASRIGSKLLEND